MGLETEEVDVDQQPRSATLRSGSATLPHTPGRLSLKLPLKDRESRALYNSIGTPTSPTSTATNTTIASLIPDSSMSTPFTHKNPSHAIDAFSALNQMRANNEVSKKVVVFSRKRKLAHAKLCSCQMRK